MHIVPWIDLNSFTNKNKTGKNHSAAIIFCLMEMHKLFPFLSSIIWIVLVQDWHEVSGKKKGLYLWYIFREATLYMLDLFKVLWFDRMAASVITFHSLCFLWEIRVDWGANQIRNIEKVTAVLQTTSYPGLQRLLTFCCLIPMTKTVTRTEEAKAWILSFWQWLDRKWRHWEVTHPFFSFCSACS